MTSAIYITGRTDGGYGHINAYIGSIDLDEARPAFRYVTADSDRYLNGWSFSVTCQIGSGTDNDCDKYSRQRDPYAIRIGIDCRSMGDAVEIDRMPTLAKAAAKLRKALDKVADQIGRPETLEDHILALYLATKPERMITETGGHLSASDKHAPATADGVRQAVRHALSDVKRQLFGDSVAAA